MKTARFRLSFISLLILPLTLFVFFQKDLQAATIDVTSNADSGPNTLRKAILDSNTSIGVLDTITFHIGGGGAQTIIPLSALPGITDPVIIDGTTQPGFSGTPLIELDGNGLSADGLILLAGGSTVRGLVINRFNGNGILLQTNGGNTLQGNFIGTDASGTGTAGNAIGGVTVQFSFGNTIGGTTPAERNVISGNSSGILLDQASATIQGNFIGTDVTGTQAVGNSVLGIDLTNNSDNVVIGGTVGVSPGGACTGACNLISGQATGTAIDVGFGGSFGVTGTLIQGNKIGTQVDGVSPLGNRYGITVSLNSTNITIGGPTPPEGNVIAFNSTGAPSSSGVILMSGTGVSIRGNSIFSNEDLGIDLTNTAVQIPNDPTDADTGNNNLQNFPVLTAVTSDGCSTNVQGTLNSTPGTVFTLDFYSNPPSDPNEGKVYLGSLVTSPTDSNGDVGFSTTLPMGTAAGDFVTATATDPNNNTSEFSLGVAATGATPTIGSLQFSVASYSVNENGGSATITVTRMGGSDCPVSVAFATSDGTAAAGLDYTATSGVLNWANGDAADKTFTIPILDDAFAESDETVNLNLSNPTGGATLGTPPTALLTILDNDSGFTVNGGGCSLGEILTSPFSFWQALPFLSVAVLGFNKKKSSIRCQTPLRTNKKIKG